TSESLLVGDRTCGVPDRQVPNTHAVKLFTDHGVDAAHTPGRPGDGEGNTPPQQAGTLLAVHVHPAGEGSSILGALDSEPHPLPKVGEGRGIHQEPVSVDLLTIGVEHPYPEVAVTGTAEGENLPFFQVTSGEEPQDPLD